MSPTVKVATALTIVGCAIAVCRTQTTERLHPCGHPITLSERLGQLIGQRSVTRHCCGALSLIAYLKQIDGGIATFQVEHGSNAVCLADLREYLREIDNWEVQFETHSSGWSVAVPAQGIWPGNYLLTSDRNIHFNRDRTATTNDVDLLDRKSR